MKIVNTLVAFLIILSICFISVLTSYGDSFSIYEENDFPEKDNTGGVVDGYYTQGLQLQYEHANRWGLKLAQQIYTPENKDSPLPQYGDRPYAGYLHGAWYKNFQYKERQDYFQIDVGVIGPASCAEQTQNSFHKWLNMALAQGWQYQLRNEPTLNVAYYSTLPVRLFSCSLLSLEYRPVAGANLGNVLVDAEIGNYIRVGYNMPMSFNPTIFSFSEEKKTNPYYAYAFAGVMGQAIAYDHLLDGSLFQSEQVSVKHNNFVANGQFGACIGICAFEISITHTEITEQWSTQPNRYAKYDSIKLTYNW